MEILILLAILVCPLVMGTAMLLMMRGMRGHAAGAESRETGVHRTKAGPTKTTS